MENFKQIAPYLTNPLVLVGFVLLLFFGIHRTLLRAGIIKPLAPSAGGKAINSLLKYGFWIALVTIVLGFTLAAFRAHLEGYPRIQKGQADTARLTGLAAVVEGFCRHSDALTNSEVIRDDAVRACAKAVEALADISASKLTKDDALARLEKGDTGGAKALFRELLERKAAEGKVATQQAAEAARHLGALAFFSNTRESLEAYQKSLELDPNSREAWNHLGHLLDRVGRSQDADEAYSRALQIATSNNDKRAQSEAYGFLGSLRAKLGDIAHAETMLKSAVALAEDLDIDEPRAIAYGDLGNFYIRRGELKQAEALLKKSLVISNSARLSLGMTAHIYADLGIVYQLREELVEAEKMQKKALEIWAKLGRRGEIAKAIGNLGIVSQHSGDLDTAEQLFRKALEFDHELEDKELAIQTYMNLGTIYGSRRDAVQAEEMFRRALEMSDAMGLKTGSAHAFLNLATVYVARGDLVQAQEMSERSLKLFTEIGDAINTELARKRLAALAEIRQRTTIGNR